MNRKYLDASLSAQERAEDIVKNLTVEEMAEQLRYDAPANEKIGLKRYNWWNEGLHGLARAGTATMFPQAIGLAAMFDESVVRSVAEVISTEARAKYNTVSQVFNDRDIYKGLTLWSPNINIFRDPRWGRGHETFGEDPYLTARLGVSFVRGLQGEGKHLKAAACAKHFAVHSGPEAIRHEFDAICSAKDMEETYLPAFKALVAEARVEGVMGAYNRVNGEGACASEFLMGKLREWGFDGYFVSDCWALRDFHTSHGLTATAPQSAALALKMGCDLNCGNTYLHILTAYREGLIDEEDIRKACVHLMRTRIRLGMLDEKTEFDNIPYSEVSSTEHKALSLKCAEKSMVLLKNDGILPLDTEKIRSLAVIGPNADSREALRGNYFGTADGYTTFLEGITERFDGRIYYSEGCHLYKEKLSGLAVAGDRYAEAEACAANADAVIVFVGLDATLEGEEGDTGNEFSSGDKKDLRLPKSQQILLEKVMRFNKPTVVVLTSGSAINIERNDENALIETFYPSSEGGTALAEILFGDISPSGKLPVTFYEDADLLPEITDYSMKNRTYRYAEGNVLYPFGYGLTYGKVQVVGLEYANGTAVVTAENRGARDCDEVIQLYIRDECEHAVRNHSLCGFAPVHINAGEGATVKIDVPAQAFEAVDENGERGVFSQSFKLYAGVCQPDWLSEELSGTECAVIVIPEP